MDRPLAEPPLDGMTAPEAEIIASGTFEGLERTGEGEALLYRMADDRLALRLEDFATVATAGISLWISPLPSPASSQEIVDGEIVDLGPIRATAGDQNYLLPESITADQVGTIVVWCVPNRIAFAVAPLAGPPS